MTTLVTGGHCWQQDLWRHPLRSAEGAGARALCGDAKAWNAAASAYGTQQAGIQWFTSQRMKKGESLMKLHPCVSVSSSVGSRICRQATSTMLGAIFAGLLLAPADSAFALSFTRGTASTVGSEQFSSSTDTNTSTEFLTAPNTITTGFSTLEHRVQYDIITANAGSLNTWTVHYDPSLASGIIGATVPTGFVTSGGTAVTTGGLAVTTLFNSGFGVYNYNPGSTWTIDYEADHITFAGVPDVSLPSGAGVGELLPTANLPSFDIEFNPNIPFGVVPADVVFDDQSGSGTVTGPVVPEPSSLSLILVGTAIMACRRFRKA